MNTTPTDRPRTGLRFRWPLIVVALLVAHAAIITYFIVNAVSDENFSAVPDAYEQAIDYDARKARLAETQNLGWAVELRVGSLVDDRGRRTLDATLSDADGAAVAGADVDVRLSRHAGGGGAGEPVRLEETGTPGRYAAPAPLGVAGLYSAEVSAGRREGTERQQALFDRELRVGMEDASP